MQSIDSQLKKAIQKAVQDAFDVTLDEQQIGIEIPKNKEHGDFSSNVAMQMTRTLRKNPRLIAQEIVDHFPKEAAGIEEIEIAGPGFLNLTLKKDSFAKVVEDILRQQAGYGTQPANGIKVDLEFVSANPT